MVESQSSRSLARGLRDMYDATASVTGGAFFEALARSFADAMGMRLGMVALIERGSDRSSDKVRALALWAADHFETAGTYPMAGTACARAADHGTCAFPRDVASHFPDDELLVAAGIQALVAVRIDNATGEPLGVLLAFDQEPAELPSELNTLASSFSTRAAAEIQRLRAEETIRRDALLAESLARIAQHLNDHLGDRKTMTRGLCQMVATTLGMDSCQVLGLGAQDTHFEVIEHHGLAPSLSEDPRPISRADAERLWPETGSVIVIDDPAAVADPVIAAAFRRADVRTAAAAACWRDGRIVGLVSTHTYGRIHSFLPAELHFLRAVSSQLASAMAVHAAHELVRKSENKYRHIVTQCMEGVWTIDGEGRTTYANEQLAHMLGYTVEELMCRTMFDFMDERAAQIAHANMARRRTGLSERHDFRWRHKDGHDVWTEMSTKPMLDEQGRFVGASAFLTDITERRRLESKIQQAQKLESLGVLAGGIAHDFNNLLVGILGNVGLAQMDLSSESPAMPALHDIQAAALRAADLTKQMLAYSGKGRFVVQRLDLNKLLEESQHLLGSVISKRAALRFNLAKKVPDIEADAAQVRQVLMNLVTNASDALEDSGGIISISTGVVHADRNYLATTYLDEALTEGDYVSLEVSDSGMGMSADTQAKIFDPFFTTKFPGRGLGLAAVLGILRGHRGAIKVYSELGKGSTFKILVPCADQLAVSVTRDLPTLPPRPMVGVVLVADDEPAVRQVSKRVLEKLGYRVLLAEDGRAAIALFEAHQDEVSVVLLDMTMPGPSGDEVFRELRRLRPHVRVVLTSGYNEQDATARFNGKGLAGFLQKPWRPADLEAVIESATARKS